MSTINIVIGEKYYNKNPRSTELGEKIVSEGILLMDELGFENFTFKKLAERIESTEASIYRYFDNKLKLLVYLTTTYWAWVEYQIDVHTHHLQDCNQKMEMILQIVCNLNGASTLVEMPGIDVQVLRRLVVNESDKTYLTKQVDEINKEGLFRGFKGLCHKISVIISEINPKYNYPHTLSSMLLESANQQRFFAEHLPSLTEVSTDRKSSVEQQLYEYLKQTVTKILA